MATTSTPDNGDDPPVKRRGPAPRGPFTGKRKTLTTRITEGVREQLERAAEANDRSLSQEIEFRLEKSFLTEEAIRDRESTPDNPDDYDPIERPRHYCRKGGIEPFDFIQSNRLGFAAGNVVKYIIRYEEKGGVVDLQKARWYLQRLIDEER